VPYEIHIDSNGDGQPLDEVEIAGGRVTEYE
jgi:hypothetical protein